MEYPKLVNCSPNDVLKALKKLRGFSLKQASPKHYKVEHTATGKAWMIPRRVPVKKGLMWDMVRNYLNKLGYADKEIFEHLWC